MYKKAVVRNVPRFQVQSITHEKYYFVISKENIPWGWVVGDEEHP